ncbi:hypothetical protein D3C76_1091620 [compost metagenome]
MVNILGPEFHAAVVLEPCPRFCNGEFDSARDTEEVLSLVNRHHFRNAAISAVLKQSRYTKENLVRDQLGKRGLVLYSGQVVNGDTLGQVTDTVFNVVEKVFIHAAGFSNPTLKLQL